MVDTENKYFHTHLTINRSRTQNISQLFWLKTANQKLISTIVTLNNSSHALNKHKLQADVMQIYKYTKTEKKQNRHVESVTVREDRRRGRVSAAKCSAAYS